MKKRSKFYKLGIGFIILAFISWLIALIVPFISFSIKVKAGIITGSLIFGEILFWIGVLLAGKEVVIKFKSYLDPKNWKNKWIKE